MKWAGQELQLHFSAEETQGKTLAQDTQLVNSSHYICPAPSRVFFLLPAPGVQNQERGEDLLFVSGFLQWDVLGWLWVGRAQT